MSGRALITGATGFVGRLLSAYLVEQGWDVVCTGYPPADGAVTLDVTDREQVNAVLEEAGELTHVFHLAAIAFVPTANRDPALAFRVNLLGAVNLTGALVDRGLKARFINIATSEIYGPPQSLPVTEGHPVNPPNPYAISKAAADQYCAYLFHAAGLDVIRMRPFNHSGPGQSDDFVLSNFARQVADIEAGRNEAVVRVGNLKAARDFLHVRDVVRAYEQAALRGRSGEAYNVCSGQARTIQTALDQLLALSNHTIEVRHDPERIRPVDVPEIYGSHDKLSADTGWEPATPFDDILRDLLTYWRG